MTSDLIEGSLSLEIIHYGSTYDRCNCDISSHCGCNNFDSTYSFGKKNSPMEIGFEMICI